MTGISRLETLSRMSGCVWMSDEISEGNVCCHLSKVKANDTLDFQRYKP